MDPDYRVVILDLLNCLSMVSLTMVVRNSSLLYYFFSLSLSLSLLIVPGRATESKELNSESEKGIDVFVEDWSSDFCSKEASQYYNSSPPLTVDPLAFSLPLGATDISDQPATLVDDTLLGKGSYSEWFEDKFSGFDDFLGTSLKGLEEPVTAFQLAVENEIQQRTFKDKIDKSEKSSGRKGIRELRGLFSFVNYGSASSRRSYWFRV